MRITKKEETVLLVLSLKSATSSNSIITELLTEEKMRKSDSSWAFETRFRKVNRHIDKTN